MSGLLEREIAFLDALRAAGLNVSLAEVLDSTRAMGAIDLMDREALRQAFAASAVKRPNHRATYDRLFDLWFPAVTGDPSRAEVEGDPDAAPGEGPADPEALREALAACVLKRPAHRGTFDTLFDLWFPAVLGDPSAFDDEQDADADGARRVQDLRQRDAHAGVAQGVEEADLPLEEAALH